MASTMRFDKWDNPTGTLSLDITQATPGLVPIVPTSVTLASGSSTISSNGLVTVTGSTNTTLNGVFSAAYKNYLIHVNITSGASGSLWGRLRNSSGVASSAYTGTYLSMGAASGPTSTAAMDFISLAGGDFLEAVVSQPFLAIQTKYMCRGEQNNGTMYLTAGRNTNSTSYDSLDILKSDSAVMSATIQVYGYK